MKKAYKCQYVLAKIGFLRLNDHLWDLLEHRAVKKECRVKAFGRRGADRRCFGAAGSCQIKVQHRHAQLSAEMIAHPGAQKEKGVGQEYRLAVLQHKRALAVQYIKQSVVVCDTGAFALQDRGLKLRRSQKGVTFLNVHLLTIFIFQTFFCGI